MEKEKLLCKFFLDTFFNRKKSAYCVLACHLRKIRLNKIYQVCANLWCGSFWITFSVFKKILMKLKVEIGVYTRPSYQPHKIDNKFKKEKHSKFTCPLWLQSPTQSAVLCTILPPVHFLFHLCTYTIFSFYLIFRIETHMTKPKHNTAE